MSSLLALIFVTCGSGQMAALSKHCPAQRLWAAVIGWCLSEEESRDFDAQPGPELGSRSVFGSTVQELGMWQPLHLPSPTPFHPWAVCPTPPPSTHSPCSLWMHGFHVVPPSAPPPRPGETHSMGPRVRVCPGSSELWMDPHSTQAVHNLEAGWEINPFHPFARVRSRFESRPTADASSLMLVTIPFAGGGVLIFHPVCLLRPVHDSSAGWRHCASSSRVRMLWNEPVRSWQSDPGCTHSYSTPASACLELTVISPLRPGVGSSQLLSLQPFTPDVSQRYTLTPDQPPPPPPPTSASSVELLVHGSDRSFWICAPCSWFSRSTSSISSSAWCSCAQLSGSRSVWTYRCWPTTSGGEQRLACRLLRQRQHHGAVADQSLCCRYTSRPVMSSPGLYDPTTIMNADILAFCQKEGWCKLAFYLLSFFYYLYG